jgi:tetratricopeptide (TPR) repeat protein
VSILSNWKQNLPTGERLYALLAVVATAVIAVGYLLFAQASLVPQWQARDKLLAQLTSAEQRLAEARKAQEKSPERLQAQLATAQAALNQAGSLFLTDSKAAEAMSNLYVYAGQSGVTIASLQTLPSPKQTKGAYDVRMFQLQAEGDTPNLTRFVALIKEAALPGYVISNVSISDGSQLHWLTMDITLYTSPYASAAVVTTRPVIATQPPGPQPAATPTPTLTAQQQLMQRLDTAWAAGDWASAVSLSEQIHAADPQNAELTLKLYSALVNYGYQLAAEGKLEEAKTAYGRALVIKPDGGEAAAGLMALTGWWTPTATPLPAQTIYVVRAGDTLFSIARRYGVTVQAIMSANGLTNYNIRVGQQLVIPTW